MKTASNKRIRTGLLSVALAGGTLLGASQLGGVANAQTDEAPANETPVDETPETPETSETPADDTTDAPEGEQRPDGNRTERGQELAEVLGIDADDLRDQLREGATLADIAEQNDVDVQSVIDVVVAQMTEHIDRAVEDGRLDADAAAERIAGLEERATAAVDEGRRPGADGRRARHGPSGEHGDCADDATGEDGEAEAEVDDEPTESSLGVESSTLALVET